MPYSSVNDLDPAIREKYGRCAKAFVAAFNSTYADHGESRAFAAAHAAAKKCKEAQKSMPVTDIEKDTETQAEFKIFSAALEPLSATKDGKRRLRTIASSSVEDLGGDVITLPALQAMAASAKNMTVFRNHSYKVPDDILGSVEKAEVKHAGLDGNGKPIYDLALDVVVREDQKSVETFEAIQSGVKLGTSIGAMIPKGGATRNENGGYTYDMLHLKEASIVGIPQNPRSWVEYATKAMKTAEVEEDEDDTNEGFHAEATLENSDGTSTNLSLSVTPPTEMQKEEKPEVHKDHGEELDDRDWANLPEGDQTAADALYAEYDELDKAADPELVKAPLSSEARSNLKESDFACPEKRKYPIHDKAHIRNALSRCAQEGTDKCGCGKVRAAAKAAGIGQKDVEPDLTVSAEPTLIASIDAVTEAAEDTPAQELGESVPESAEDSVTDGDAQLLDDTVTRSVDMLAGLVKTMTRERSVLLQRAVDAETARDAAIQQAKDANENVRLATEIVKRLANTPLGRKAVFKEAEAQFSEAVKRVYTPEVIKMLEKKDGD